MKTFYSICIYLLVALGTGHTLLTPVFYPGFSADTLWFAGTGLSLIFLGLLNIGAERSPEQTLRAICITANLIGTAFIALVTIAVPELQAFLAVLVVLGTTLGSIAVLSSAQQGQIEEA